MMKLTFSEFRNYNQTRDAEFKCRIDKDEDWNIVDRSNELAGEVGELCNLTKKIRRQRMGMYKSGVTEEMVAEELADVIICADLLAMDLDIDLGEAVRDKFNKSSDKFGLLTKIPKPPTKQEKE